MVIARLLSILWVGILLSAPAWSACIEKSVPLPEFCTRAPEGDAGCVRESGSANAISIQCKTFQNTCSGYDFETAPFSFASYQPGPETIKGVQLPRTGREWTLYRGARENTQITVKKALAGIFGDSVPTIGAFEHFKITQILTGQVSIDAYAGDLKKFGNYDDVAAVKKKCGALGERAAAFFAADILDKGMKRFAAKRNFADYFLDYKAEQFFSQGFGNSGETMIYTGLHPRIASVYGGNVLVFGDSKQRGFDANFWNYKNKGGLWTIHSLDIGEYIIPNYLDSREIKGIYFTNWDYYPHTEATFGIQYGIHSFTFEGKTYALLYEGRGESCVTMTSKFQMVPCTDEFQWLGSPHYVDHRDSTGAVFPKPYEVSGGSPLPVLGIIAPCPEGRKCSLPTDLNVITFPESKVTESKRVLDEILSTRLYKGNEYYRTVYVDLKGRSQGIQVVSAHSVPEGDQISVFNDVTPYTANFCNGKKECGYKVSTEYIPDTAPGKIKTFTVRWKCAGADAEKTVSGKEGTALLLSCGN